MNGYINYPQVLELALSVSSPKGECSIIVCVCTHSNSSNFRSNRYPLLQGGQRRSGFHASPRLLHMIGAAGIKPRPLYLRANALTTKSRAQKTKTKEFIVDKCYLHILIQRKWLRVAVNECCFMLQFCTVKIYWSGTT